VTGWPKAPLAGRTMSPGGGVAAGVGVDVGVEGGVFVGVAVAVQVGVFVGVLLGVLVAVGPSCASTAPMSQNPPSADSSGRGWPR
jgi:hypothetical protein